ncbi:CobW family GTP-binding protein [Pseudoduganella buxea]|uniref:Cobalamin biosynthesis protein CobW n=1 Tax=Pseudoduganella buxea TaxID=1949069 RepID=A0A6I3T0I3_9BURK|nr:GTP-binding protein [Pseudoduganella buxea]MTV54415.1 GTP-binding protein [Pseudoduganella buxea]GGC10727.1 cobalamin biosynthesis protein CobW [Pseudoduganella buxea]
MTAAAPIPVTIVTGFLGAGKTTLLRGLIERRQTRRLALMINEFGEISVDGALVRAASEGDAHVQIEDFAHGLIAYGDDTRFVPAMQALARRRANVDHVLIETSGLALPTAAMALLQGADLAADFVLDATLAVVDTPLLLSGAFEHGAEADAAATMFDQQLEFADVVVLNKIDGLDEAALLEAETRVRRRAPNVRFLELAYNAQLDIRLALGLRLHQGTRTDHGHTFAPLPDANATPLASQYRLNGHAHSGLAAHSHGLATHKHFHEQDPGWLSFVLRSDAEQEVEPLTAALVDVAKAQPVLRCKGHVRVQDRSVLVQGVRTRVAVSPDAAAGNAARRSQLVFIGYHISRAQVAALLSAGTGTTWR